MPWFPEPGQDGCRDDSLLGVGLAMAGSTLNHSLALLAGGAESVNLEGME